MRVNQEIRVPVYKVVFFVEGEKECDLTLQKLREVPAKITDIACEWELDIAYPTTLEATDLLSKLKRN